jgi:hypothetical protein
MAGAGYRTFASGEVLTSTNVQTYLMDQAVQVYAGTAARASAVPSPSTGMVAYSTATGLQVFNGSAWTSVGGATYASISGGASTALGTAIGGSTYNVHTFTTDANLICTSAGLIDVLMFAGGSGGAASATIGVAGGGGAGGVIEGTIYLAVGTVAVDVGAGGASNTSGSGSSLNTASRGFGVAGGGRGNSYGVIFFGEQGGCGGGGAGVADTNLTPGRPSSNTGVSGFKGGDGFFSNTGAAGGGGGTTAAGGTATGTAVGAAGGAGYDVSTFIGGSALYKGAGGGGGGSSTGGAGGSSVGGAGGGNAAGSAAAANTASGGGGAGGNFAGGAGGSGIIYIRVKTS